MKVTDKIEITNEDNMELMARYPDKYFDLAIVDPPYGLGIDGQKKSVAKIKKSGKTKAHKIQAAVAMEQRAGVMGKASSAGVYRKFIDSTKRTKKSKGGIINMTKMKYI